MIKWLLILAMLVPSLAWGQSMSEFGEDPEAGAGVGSSPSAGGADTTFAVFVHAARMVSWTVKASNASACSAMVVQFSTDSTNWFNETATKDSTLTQTMTGALLGHSLAIGRIAVTIPQSPQGLGGAAASTLLPYIPWRWARAILHFYSLAVTSAPAGVTVTPATYYDNEGMARTASEGYRADR